MPLDVPILDPCSFCDYLQGVRPFTILERNEIVATLVTREQRGRGHLLVVPVRHRETILEVVPDEYAPLLDAVARAARAIADGFDPEGVVVWQNNGKSANQTVPHVHFHVAGTLPQGGTDWGDVPWLPIEETERIADGLRPHLS